MADQARDELGRFAESASNAATKAELDAVKSKTKEGFTKAADLHQKAADAHRAADQANPQKGSPGIGSYAPRGSDHNEKQNIHERSARRMRGEAMSIKDPGAKSGEHHAAIEKAAKASESAHKAETVAQQTKTAAAYNTAAKAHADAGVANRDALGAVLKHGDVSWSGDDRSKIMEHQDRAQRHENSADRLSQQARATSAPAKPNVMKLWAKSRR